MGKTKNIEPNLKKFKSPCCKTTWSVKGRANYRCDKCNKDITMDIMFLYQALIQ